MEEISLEKDNEELRCRISYVRCLELAINVKSWRTVAVELGFTKEVQIVLSYQLGE